MALKADKAWIGYTDPNSTDWQTYTGPDPETSGLYVDVDFSDAGFSTTPFITANLVGEVDTWVMQVSIGQVTNSTARIYIRSTVAGFEPTVAMASAKNWGVLYWTAQPEGGYTLPPMTIATHPCDNA